MLTRQRAFRYLVEVASWLNTLTSFREVPSTRVRRLWHGQR
jgi:hypothetical protein